MIRFGFCEDSVTGSNRHDGFFGRTARRVENGGRNLCAPSIHAAQGPPLTAPAAALRRGCEWPQGEERGDFARPRKFPNFGSSVRLSARALAGEELRLRVHLPCLAKALARGVDVALFSLDAGNHEPEPPVGLVVFERM